MRLETAGGLLLMGAALLAMITANSPLSTYYDMLLEVPVEVRVGALHIAKPLILWINDGLMAIFFFMVGLELKREIVEGELSSVSNVVLPLAGAAGGIVIPVVIYIAFNSDESVAMAGWAIPASTDIAFALGVLVLFGRRVPLSLKVFLVSVAIFDDIAAIVIIAIFYSGDLSMTALFMAIACTAVLYIMNRAGVANTSPYICIGLIMWTALLKSGVHATLAGVVLASFIPMSVAGEADRSPLKSLESDLHHLVAFIILPIFAFSNSGISFRGMGIEDFLHPVSLGIAAGLFFGKQIGVFGFCWIAIKTGVARIPAGTSYGSLYGASVLCGIGFTMSMFIGSLAFESRPADLQIVVDERVGIIIGSLLSACLGWVVLNRTLSQEAASADRSSD